MTLGVLTFDRFADVTAISSLFLYLTELECIFLIFMSIVEQPYAVHVVLLSYLRYLDVPHQVNDDACWQPNEDEQCTDVYERAMLLEDRDMQQKRYTI